MLQNLGVEISLLKYCNEAADNRVLQRGVIPQLSHISSNSISGKLIMIIYLYLQGKLETFWRVGMSEF